jgi:D-xylose transport system substrate-binding protein
MSLKRNCVFTGVVISSLVLAACGSSSKNSSGNNSTTTTSKSGGGTVVLSVTSFTSDFSAMDQLKSVTQSGHGKVYVLLPDTQSSARYVEFDAPYLKQAATAAGYAPSDFVVENAQGSKSTMQTQADAAITNGATVLIVDPLDSGSGATIEANAKAKGVKTIDYDRLTLNGSASYYVSFDNVKVGKLIGQGEVDAINAWKVSKPQVLIMDGDPTDNNAKLFNQGYTSVLNPLFQAGTYTKVGEPAGTWDNQKALTNFQQQFTAHPNINAVVAPNDGVGNSVISVLKTNKIPANKIPVTGQDATLQGMQNILDGYQYMSVYKPIYLEAQAAVALASYLRAGQAPPAALVNGATNNQVTNVPSILLTPLAVVKSNMNDTVIKDKFVKAAELCAGAYAAKCSAAGITTG